MLAEIVIVGGVIGVLLGLLEISHHRSSDESLTPEAAIREAMRGPEGGAVRAEFRRGGIEPLDLRRPTGFQF